MQVVRDELVVSLEIVIGHIEKDRAIFAFGALFQYPDREFVTLHERRQ